MLHFHNIPQPRTHILNIEDPKPTSTVLLLILFSASGRLAGIFRMRCRPCHRRSSDCMWHVECECACVSVYARDTCMSQAGFHICAYITPLPVHAHVHVHPHVHTHTYIHTYIHTCVHLFVHSCVVDSGFAAMWFRF